MKTWWISVTNVGVVIIEADCLRCVTEKLVSVLQLQPEECHIVHAPEGLLADWLKHAPRDTIIDPLNLPPGLYVEVNSQQRQKAALN